jgi:hypothetical protein
VQPPGFGDCQHALIDLTGHQSRGTWQSRLGFRPVVFLAQMLNQRILLAAVVARWARNRGRIVRMKSEA